MVSFTIPCVILPAPFAGQWMWQQDNGNYMPVPPNTAQWTGRETPDGTTGTCAYFYMNIW